MIKRMIEYLHLPFYLSAAAIFLFVSISIAFEKNVYGAVVYFLLYAMNISLFSYSLENKVIKTIESRYATCIVFTKDFPGRIRIETITFQGKIMHPENKNAAAVFDKEKATQDALADKKSLKLLAEGHAFFLCNHIIIEK